MRKLLKVLTSRVVIFGLLILLQVGLFFVFVYRAALYYQIIPFLQVFALALVVYVINKQEDASYKIAWSVFILVTPVIGGMMYLLCAGRKMPKKLYYGTTQANHHMYNLLQQDPDVIKRIEDKPDVSKVFRYALHASDFPVYTGTDVTYFSSGEEMFQVMIQELKKAKKFIFLEYFIIGEGEMWDTIETILEEKVKEGVEVKLIYDDFGCSTTLPRNYQRRMNEKGIETYRFNKMRPALIIQMNNRDHRKLMIIDNKVGFTGGINIADEYINKINRFGYWRDSGVMVKGNAVISMTVMFLGMYTFLKNDDLSIDYSNYLNQEVRKDYQGLIQPFSDTPTDDADVGLSMHLNLINYAKNYIYIDTPYLVLNGDMQTALCLAAQNGVDVRILVPHIPDKKYVFQITRGNYEVLINAGVKIYEFTPGFNHSKTIVCDDIFALVGTVNTDYRSYFLHFEDGVLIYDNPEIIKMKESFLESLKQSQEITLEACRRVSLIPRIYRGILKIMSPLL